MYLICNCLVQSNSDGIWNRLAEELKRAKVLNKTTAKCTNNFRLKFILATTYYYTISPAMLTRTFAGAMTL